MKTEKDYEELLRLFNKHKVKYCIVGAYAVAYYARPRYTKDLDIFIDPVWDNAARLVKALEEFGFKGLNLRPEDFMVKGSVVQLGYEPVRVDIVSSISGCSFGTVWKSREVGRYGKEKVFFIGLAQLIKNKRAAQRAQDKADLELLAKVRARRRPR